MQEQLGGQGGVLGGLLALACSIRQNPSVDNTNSPRPGPRLARSPAMPPAGSPPHQPAGARLLPAGCSAPLESFHLRAAAALVPPALQAPPIPPDLGRWPAVLSAPERCAKLGPQLLAAGAGGRGLQRRRRGRARGRSGEAQAGRPRESSQKMEWLHPSAACPTRPPGSVSDLQSCPCRGCIWMRIVPMRRVHMDLWTYGAPVCMSWLRGGVELRGMSQVTRVHPGWHERSGA